MIDWSYMRVLIVIDNVGTGGIASSLRNFVSHVSRIADCDVLSFKPVPADYFDSRIKVLHGDRRLELLGLSQQETLQISVVKYIARAALTCIARIVSGEFARRILYAGIHPLCGYDYAISFAHDNGWKYLSKGCNDFVLNKVDATKKIAFIHCDYEQFGGYDPRQEIMYSRFDTIACVSHSCRKQFIKMFPKLSDKCVVQENFIEISPDRFVSTGFSFPQDGKIHFVTVARLSEEKGLDRAIRAFETASMSGLDNFSWAIVGDGPERMSLEKQVNDAELANRIMFIGEKANPYPYIAAADAFLLPSLHEAAPMVFGEAAALGTVVLTTRTSSADELVQNRGLGYVCDNNEAGLYELISSVLRGEKNLCGTVVEDINELAIQEMCDLFNLRQATSAELK